MFRLLRIAAREYFSYLKTPGFWLSLIIAPAIGLVSGYGPIWAEKSAPERTLAVVDYAHAGPQLTKAITVEAKGARVLLVAPPPDVSGAPDATAAGVAVQSYVSGKAALPDGRRLDGAAIFTGSPAALSVDVWTRDIGDGALMRLARDGAASVMRAERLKALGIDPTKIAAADAAQPQVKEFSPKAVSGGRVSLRDRMPTFAAFGLSFALWMLVLTGAGILLNSVIEEKSNRVLEVLLSSASVPEILGGKILGAAALAATMLVVLGGAGLFALARFTPAGTVDQLIGALLGHGLILIFAAYFVLGYLMYASIFTAIGAFCETPREAQTLVGPLMLMLSLPMIFLSQALKRPDSPLLEWLGWFPPFTPFLMTARAASGLPWWQVVGSLLLMTATSATVVWISGRAFRAGALSNAKFDLPAFFRGIASAGK